MWKQEGYKEDDYKDRGIFFSKETSTYIAVRLSVIGEYL